LKDKTDDNRERNTGNYYSKNERKVKKRKVKKRKEKKRKEKKEQETRKVLK
jgi:hypothetical protein